MRREEDGGERTLVAVEAELRREGEASATSQTTNAVQTHVFLHARRKRCLVVARVDLLDTVR